MRNDVTAVILSDTYRGRMLPSVPVYEHVSFFSDASGLLASRFESLKHVTTPWFFWLDDDDELPDNIDDVLTKCIDFNPYPLAYTDEMVVERDTGRMRIRQSGPYNEDDVIRDPTFLHHLVVCRTDAALRAIDRLPRGMYHVESMLFFEVAKEGALYVPEVGYIWNRGHTGMHRHHTVTIALAQSQAWAHRNRRNQYAPITWMV